MSKSADKPPVDPMKLYLNAQSYNSAYYQLIKSGRSHEGPNVFYMWPGAVCQAFAIELFLKCIYAIRGITTRGHDLRDLFEKLGEEDKRYIESHFNESVEKHPIYSFVASEDKPEELEALPMDLVSVLNRCKDNFAVARYWHEGAPQCPHYGPEQPFYTAGLDCFVSALLCLIVEIRPDFNHVLVGPVHWKKVGKVPPT